jgi:hypothetical protein
MSGTETPVIDLDQPAPSPGKASRIRWHRWSAAKIPAVAALVLMMVSGTLGAFGAAFLTAQHAHPDHRPSFSVLAFADQGRGPAEFENGLARLDGQLTVVNAGPVPINVRSLQTTPGDVQFRHVTQGRSIEPGAASQMDVVVSLVCPTPSGRDHVVSISGRSSLILEATEGSRMSSSVNFDSGAWYLGLLATCPLA